MAWRNSNSSSGADSPGPRTNVSARAAESPNRPCGDLEHEHASLVDPALGMDGSMVEADCAGRCSHSTLYALLHLWSRGRRRDVDGLLEEGAVKRIGLVENCQHVHRRRES